MQFKRLRTTATIACGSGMIALALTGCNDNGDKASASPGSPSSVATTPVSNSSHSPVPATKTGQGNQSETPSCMASELDGVLQLQPPAGNEEEAEKATATLILTNRSSESCTLPAGFTPLGKGGRNNYTAIPSHNVNYPGAGMTIKLHPHGAAYAGTKWFTTKGCPGGVTDGLGAAWHSSWIPLTYRGMSDGYKPPLCSNLTIGTLQPAMNGVNFT